MSVGLPPFPYKDPPGSYTWSEWFRKLRDSTLASYQWTNLIFTGSNLTSILTRNHNDLQNIQGGAAADYYHITSAQSTSLLGHLTDTSNPHSVTYTQVGAEPANANIQAHISSTSNPHSVTKSQVGLGNVENTALSTWAGSINLTTLGTIVTGTWNATTIGETKGGTGQSTWTLGDLLYSNASNTLAKLAGNTTSTLKLLSQTGTGAVSAAPAWKTLTELGITTNTVSNFMALNSATDLNVTGDATVYTVIFDTEVFDASGDYNNATGVFTAPATGKYRFSASVRLDGLTTAMTTHAIALVTSNRTYQVVDVITASPYTVKTMTITTLADMDSGDTASVQVYTSGGAKVADVFGDGTTVSTWFSGEFVQ